MERSSVVCHFRNSRIACDRTGPPFVLRRIFEKVYWTTENFFCAGTLPWFGGEIPSERIGGTDLKSHVARGISFLFDESRR